MLAESTIIPLIALSESLSLLSGTLAVCGWRKLGTDKDVFQVLCLCEREHRGKGHIVSCINVTIQETLVAVSYHASNIRQTLVKGEGKNNSFIGWPGNLYTVKKTVFGN